MIDIISKFIVVFSSILLEALPFILIGAMLSSLMQVFFTEKLMNKILPKNKFLGSLEASMLGFIFPVCECVTVPIAKGLIVKNVPVNIAITYMLAAPIVNPLVIMSTYYAFNGNIKIVALRTGIGLIIAILAGIIIVILTEGKDILKNKNINMVRGCTCGCEEDFNSDSKLIHILKLSSIEFYEIGKYFIIGAILAALFQIFIPTNSLELISKNSTIGILILMLFSFLISLCSEADAFVASTFINKFSLGAITGFLVIGPMIDLKNTIMLFSVFKKSFVFKLLFVVVTLCFISSCLIF